MQFDDTGYKRNWVFIEGEGQRKIDAFAQEEKIPSDTPEKIVALKKMCREEKLAFRNKSFYEEALFMADYEDSFDFVPFSAFYPTYREMSVLQLRSYFSFRTQFRKGAAPDTSESYLYVLAYEILCRVGIRSAQDGLESLVRIVDSYKEVFPKIQFYFKGWIKDFAVYNNLTEKINFLFKDEIEAEKNISILMDWDDASDAELISAASAYSSYNIEASPFYKENPKLTALCVRKVFDEFSLKDFFQKSIKKIPVWLFRTAVFYDPQKITDAQVKISSCHFYSCKNGAWSLNKISSGIRGGAKKNSDLGSILHDTDLHLRMLKNFGRPLKASILNEGVQEKIKAAVRRGIHEMYLVNPPPINVNMARLGTIRSDSEIVREALLTEEEKSVKDEIEVPKEKLKERPKEEFKEQPQKGEEKMNDAEKNILSHLELDFIERIDSDWKELISASRVPLGVLIDNINQKLFEKFGDTVLSEEDGIPYIIEDYKEELLDFVEEIK